MAWPLERLVSGTPWEQAKFQIVTGTTGIFPGLYLLTTRSAKPGTLEMNEVSLALRTPKGLAVVVGRSQAHDLRTGSAQQHEAWS